MSSAPPRFLSRIFATLFTGPIGAGACADLEDAFVARQDERGRLIAIAWYAAHLLAPNTWVLSAKLRLRGVPRDHVSRRRGSLVSWLDFKLGFRMLVRYPGLTVIGGVAMAFAIMAGAASFEFLHQVVRPTIPLNEGNRIVAFRVWDTEANRMEMPTVHDFETWRADLTTIDNLSAYIPRERNLITGEGRGEPVRVAEITASGFTVARVPPLHGRPLLESDEVPGAPAVVVIGYRVWQNRFASDPDAVGRIVTLGGEQAMIVGVMREGFAFPVAQTAWVPFRARAIDYERRTGPPMWVFGRLAPGVSMDYVQAELDIIGRRTSVDYPDTHEHLRPEVMPYSHIVLPVTGLAAAGVLSINFFLILLLGLVCGNVALLMFARAATRESELVVRNALGASRARIVAQLFAEALVLGAVAAIVGLSVASFALRWGLTIFEAQFFEGGWMPFWFDARIAPTTILYALGLTALGALITGVMPALRVTSQGMDQRLRQAAVGSGLRFGPALTGIIITQIALMVIFPVAALQLHNNLDRIRSVEVGFRSEEFLTARVGLDRSISRSGGEETPADYVARYVAVYGNLRQRLLAEPGVVGVTFADRLPRMYHPARRVQVDPDGPAAPDSGVGHRVSSVRVDADYFNVLETPILAGRGFDSGDLEPGQHVVVVNESFVARVFKGSNPIGRRIRYLFIEELRGVFEPDPVNDPWYEVVGVVKDMGTTWDQGPKASAFYHPMALDSVFTARAVLAVRVTGNPADFGPRLRALGTAIDPGLRLDRIVPLDQVHREEIRFYRFWFLVIMMVTGIVLLLSMAGIYAVMAFTVTRRTREIGIRIALGSGSRRVVAAVLARPLVQVMVGIGMGALVLGMLNAEVFGTTAFMPWAALVGYTTVMFGVCTLAGLVPIRRAMAVEPTEALKAVL